MRKLAICAGMFSAAVLLAALISSPAPAFYLITASAGILLAVLSYILKKGRRTLILRLSAFSFAAGMLWFGLYYSETIVRADKVSGQETRVTVCVTDKPAGYDEYTRATGIIVSSDEPTLKNLKAVIYDSSSEFGLSGVEPGQLVTFDASLKRADIKYGEDYDYYSSQDIFLIANVMSEIEKGNITRPLSTLPVRIKNTAASKIKSVYRNSEVSAFMKSLMLGDKSDFNRNKAMRSAMSRAGIMHIVAVSGMHISFLIGFIRLCFGNGKRSALVCIFLVLFFVLVTGAVPSAVRAGIMQCILLIAPVIRRENDYPTSLMLALAVILLINPFAVLSVSLQLSFAAMAGIVLFSEKLMNFFSGCFPKFSSRRTGRYITGVVASSLSVLVLTVPLTAIHFRSVQILSPVANALVLWAVSMCFCLGYISLIFGAVSSVTAILAKYILFIAKSVSAIPFASIYIISIFSAVWLGLIYTIIFAAVVSSLKPGEKIAMPVLFSGVSLAVLLLTTSFAESSYGGVITVLDVGQGQCVAVYSGDKTVLIDCGSKNTLDSAGNVAGEYLVSGGRKQVDALYFTHLHDDHANGLSDLASLVDVKEIIIPACREDDPDLIELISAASEAGINITSISGDRTYTVGNMTVDLYPPEIIANDNENCMAVRVSVNGFSVLSTGDMGKSEEKALIEKHPDLEADLLIAGHHGSKYSSAGAFLTAVGASDAVISSGYNTYGHPTYETLARLESYGYSIHRTDTCGSVRFIVNNKD